MTLKWYLCGPMSGRPDANYPAFSHAAKILREHGIHVVSPHETIPNQDGKIPWEVCLKADIKTLMECDGVILLDGWSDSRGARLELTTALTVNMPALTFYVDDRLSRLDGGHPEVVETIDHKMACPWHLR